MKKLLILGAGGYGKTVADVAQQLGCYDKIAFLDDEKRGMPNVLGACDEVFSFADGTTEVYPAFGNNETRMGWIGTLLEKGVPVPTLVHPRAYVSPMAKLGTGTVEPVKGTSLKCVSPLWTHTKRAVSAALSSHSSS